jgi:hypothetical protein
VIWPTSPACVEGALARVSGVDLGDNPYDIGNAEERYRTWRWAWLYADRLLELNVDHLAASWGYDEDAA